MVVADSEPEATMNTGYSLSEDYDRLYQLVCDGHRIAGWVDNQNMRDENDQPLRDICEVRRYEEYYIQLSVRGMSYGGVWPYMMNSGSEREIFRKACQFCRLQFIDIPCTKEGVTSPGLEDANPWPAYETAARVQLALSEEWQLISVAPGIPVGYDTVVEHLDDSNLTDESRWQQIRHFEPTIAWLPAGTFMVTMRKESEDSSELKTGFIQTQS
ncbi:hypothetical protein [Marinobacter sp. MBR-105]